MIEQILRDINNFYWYKTIIGEGFAENKVICDASGFVVGQYVYIKGSIMNDGVWQIGGLLEDGFTITGIVAEEGLCNVHALRVPRGVLSLVDEIVSYNQKNTGGVISESLGDYSITYGGQGSTDTSWKKAFATRLSSFRQVYLYMPDDIV